MYTMSTERVMRLFFFFSSRRRHTRFSRDWSSDVCSSDLVSPGVEAREIAGFVANQALEGVSGEELQRIADEQNQQLQELLDAARSEERRVGKESRSGEWTADTEKDNGCASNRNHNLENKT